MVAAQTTAYCFVVDLQKPLHILFSFRQAHYRRLLKPPITPDAHALRCHRHGVGGGQALNVQVNGLRAVIGEPRDKYLRQIKLVESAQCTGF
jgi:hypothetical protein